MKNKRRCRKSVNRHEKREHKPSLSVRLVRRVIVSANSLTTSAFLLAVYRLLVTAVSTDTGSAVASSLFLVQGAQRLAAKCEVLVLNNDGLDPGVGVDVDLARRGVKGAQVRDDVVSRF